MTPVELSGALADAVSLINNAPGVMEALAGAEALIQSSTLAREALASAVESLAGVASADVGSVKAFARPLGLGANNGGLAR